ncbi:hypothetical protein [Umezawaea sp.]|uniref:hypothetical protein n=1 Tax=Umezawaea sp. TaxID=1955258 RepID=UPI002ED4EC89
MTGALVRPFTAPVTVFEAWTTSGIAARFDTGVTSTAYWPTPPRSDRSFRHAVPHPWGSAGVPVAVEVTARPGVHYRGRATTVMKKSSMC